MVNASISCVNRDSFSYMRLNHVPTRTVLAAEHDLDGVYDLGTGERYSFNTVVEMINNELGTDVDPEYVENPIPEEMYVHDTCADSSKITEATGWEPEVDLAEGVRRVCAQYT